MSMSPFHCLGEMPSGSCSNPATEPLKTCSAMCPSAGSPQLKVGVGMACPRDHRAFSSTPSAQLVQRLWLLSSLGSSNPLETWVYVEGWEKSGVATVTSAVDWSLQTDDTEASLGDA